jgi:hypothetical protein
MEVASSLQGKVDALNARITMDSSILNELRFALGEAHQVDKIMEIIKEEELQEDERNVLVEDHVKAKDLPPCEHRWVPFNPKGTEILLKRCAYCHKRKPL